DKTECVRDNGTGLIWEGKPASGDRAATNTYTNYDNPDFAQKAIDLNDPFLGYVKPTVEEVNAATNSIGYRNAVNASRLCGFTDWRIPTVDELSGIKDANQAADPLIDSMWFPNTQSTTYWTSTVSTTGANNYVHNNAARMVFFYTGYIWGNADERKSPRAVRLVRP
ncbi:MAG: DUF1566 domain-containing protein, partial [Rhodoferax sp.]|nr:DUF1566 domain-containing protein [Rhodoferax sp.]